MVNRGVSFVTFSGTCFAGFVEIGMGHGCVVGISMKFCFKTSIMDQLIAQSLKCNCSESA
jgi:hypothetical protein